MVTAEGRPGERVSDGGSGGEGGDGGVARGGQRGQRVLGGDRDEGHAHDGVGPGGEHVQAAVTDQGAAGAVGGGVGDLVRER